MTCSGGDLASPEVAEDGSGVHDHAPCRGAVCRASGLLEHPLDFLGAGADEVVQEISAPLRRFQALLHEVCSGGGWLSLAEEMRIVGRHILNGARGRFDGLRDEPGGQPGWKTACGVCPGAPEFIVGGSAHHPRLHGVPVDVPEDGFPVASGLDQAGPESTLEKRAPARSSPIEALGIPVLDEPHCGGDVAKRAADQKVEVVEKDGVGVDLDESLAGHPRDAGKEQANFSAGFEDRPLPHTPVRDVVPCSRVVDTEGARHFGLRKHSRESAGMVAGIGGFSRTTRRAGGGFTQRDAESGP